MNRAELRRFIVVVLPSSLIVALSLAAAVTLLTPNPAGDPPRPLIGDHWHAPYQIWICGQLQPHIPAFQGGVHTHADGIIHIHPIAEHEQGPGARLVKFFQYAGGLLTNDELRLPGSRHSYRNGDPCPNGSPGVLTVSVNGAPLPDWSDYIPADGDRILITFGPRP